jgi:hypothetical protein
MTEYAAQLAISTPASIYDRVVASTQDLPATMYHPFFLGSLGPTMFL